MISTFSYLMSESPLFLLPRHHYQCTNHIVRANYSARASLCLSQMKLPHYESSIFRFARAMFALWRNCKLWNFCGLASSNVCVLSFKLASRCDDGDVGLLEGYSGSKLS